MQPRNASVTRQRNRKIAPVRSLENVRCCQKADALTVTQQRCSRKRL
jgi:hypothetical protein